MSKQELVQLIGGDAPINEDEETREPAAAPGSANPSDESQPSRAEPSETRPQNPEESTASASSANHHHKMKPPGQPNRPGSGGYNLENHLVQKCGWTQEEFEEVQSKVHALAGEKLDLSMSYQRQQMRTIESICDAVKQDHACARGFEKCWATRDMLKVYLKNTSEASRRRNRDRRVRPYLLDSNNVSDNSESGLSIDESYTDHLFDEGRWNA
ncbi:hypothetical protein C8R47DRAFT_1218010 [Mycena vitilis]|nr:hypothetical protein C8R47DRAFT_1218010 [Mycena vitilis]